MSIALAATWNPRGELPRLRALLPLAGLRPSGFFGDWDGTPLGAESRRMIVIAKKLSPGEEE